MRRVVDIAKDDRVLTLSRGSLKVSLDGAELGRVPLTDIQSVLVHGHGTMVSLSLSAAMAEAGIPLVLCARNHAPVALTLPVSGNFEQAQRLGAQAELPLPRRKRLWRQLVRAKITAQARALELAGHPDHAALKKLIKVVRSGDPDNIEARAARFYWRRLLGPDFRRDPHGDGLNAHLNYGYTIIRSAMARAVVAAGLAPGLGIHHRGRLNAFQLVDDLMEPFRPLADHMVWKNRDAWSGPVTAEAKVGLANLVDCLMPAPGGVTAATRIMSALALSLAEYCVEGRGDLAWPADWAIASQGEIEFGR